MAAKGAGDQKFYEVLEDDIVEMKLILPTGVTKHNYRVKIGTTVQEEKQRIWELENITNPKADRLVLVLLLPGGQEVVLLDEEKMQFYTKQYNFGSAELKFEDRSKAKDKEGRKIRPKDFGFKLRP